MAGFLRPGALDFRERGEAAFSVLKRVVSVGRERFSRSGVRLTGHCGCVLLREAHIVLPNYGDFCVASLLMNLYKRDFLLTGTVCGLGCGVLVL